MWPRQRVKDVDISSVPKVSGNRLSQKLVVLCFGEPSKDSSKIMMQDSVFERATQLGEW